MSFERPKFENFPGQSEPEEEPTRDIEREEEEEKEREKLRGFVEKISERLRNEGVPVEKNCRIDPEAFQEIYPQEEITRDQDYVRERESKWFKGASPQKIEQEKLKNTGEKLEMLKTTIFDKFLGKSFIIARASSYDDIHNKIDNVILEKETGNLVCAFDEVSETHGEIYERKKQEVLERNRKESGGKLKYGLGIEKDKKDRRRLILREVSNIPILYVALRRYHIEERIKNLLPSSERSPDEIKLFSYFIASFDAQIRALELERHLTPALKERLFHFGTIVYRIRENFAPSEKTKEETRTRPKREIKT